MTRNPMNISPAILLGIALLLQGCEREKLSRNVRFYPGDVNGAFIGKNGKTLVVYGDPAGKLNKADMVLFTHCRRDVLWAGRNLAGNGSLAVIPATELENFSRCDSIWQNMPSARFHDYYCQTTKIPVQPFNACRPVREGEILEWEGIRIKILETPGFTRGSVSYLADVDSKRYAFTGDLIYGDGKIFDLYSLQDSLDGIGGYHGFALRLGQLVSSLQRIAGEKPDVIIPSRGPLIMDPQSSIQNLIRRARSLYANYLSTTAYRWYFPDRMKTMADHVIGTYDSAGFMPYAGVIRRDLPSWFSRINENSNSRLVVAADGSTFLIDCGIREVFETLVRMKRSGQLKSLDGIFITHYHDDHTDYINQTVREFDCPVYVTGILRDILQDPGAFDLPCLTRDPIPNLVIMEDGQKMPWKEFTLTFYDFPGQTLYHDALLLEKNDGETVFFAGDSFTPSGIDDYCLLNRNLLHPGMGYLYCLEKLKKLPENVLLCNQHVDPLFAFSDRQLDFMTNALAQRQEILKELLPWDDINYGLDEQWARIEPYGRTTEPGKTLDLSVKIFNHSVKPRAYSVRLHTPDGFRADPDTFTLLADPLSGKKAAFRLQIPPGAGMGTYLLTMDIDTGERYLHEWSECLITLAH